MRAIPIGLMAATLFLGACGATDVDDTASAAAEDSATDEAVASASSSRASVEGAGSSTDGATSDAAVRSADDAPQQSVGLQAGSVDDNESWEEYLRYRDSFAALGLAVDDLPVAGRRLLTVVDGAGEPVFDAVITITGGPTPITLRTGTDGRAVLLAPVPGSSEQQSAPVLEATVSRGSARTTVPIGAEQRQTIVLDGAPTVGAARLDVLFLVDATGSMGDEIERLKANMVGVAEQISSSPTAPDVRFALTSYRDDSGEVGDYVSRTVDFTSDVDRFVTTLRGLSAGGGGDLPEALNEAFDEAVRAPSWRLDDDVVRLVFLIADAPPHIGRGPSYVESIGAAAERGIRVFPIASSGTDDQAEFVFRQIAQATLGRFVFLSYGAGGAAIGSGSNIDPDDYDVLALDALVVRLVEDELAHLTVE